MHASQHRGLDATALIIAIALHAGLVALLLVMRNAEPPTFPVPERITVNFADEVGLTSTAPDPTLESQASVAPELGEPIPPEPEVSQPMAPPQPTVSQPAPRPRATRAPRPQPTTRATSRPQPRAQPRSEPERPRGSRLGDNFLEGQGSSTTTTDTRVPASQVGASARASIAAAISRQLKPHWSPPSGPDADRLVTVLAFRLNEDGSLAGRPRVVRQTGVNDTNRAQAERHAEQAIRAVQLAAPFDLPPEYYNAWRNVSAFSFDWNL